MIGPERGVRRARRRVARRVGSRSLRRYVGVGAYALFAALVGCDADAPPPLGEAIGYELVQVWRTGDLETSEALFHPLAVYEDRSSGTEAPGGPEAAAWAAAVRDWLDPLFIEVVDLRATDTSASIEWLREGLAVVGDTARSVRIEGVTLLEIENGLVLRATEYFDPSPLIVARGGAVTYPGEEPLRLPAVEGDDADGVLRRPPPTP